MISFNQYITEAADSAQNLHMTHADEDLYERGDVGAQAAVDFCVDVAKSLGKGSTKLTVKWDGAPAIFCGHDPADGKFFVGTKSVFSKTPKLYKTQAEIQANEAGGKAAKLAVCLEELPKIGIPKDVVLQGDLLWTQGDHSYETINGERFVTVHPNTIVYAWPADSKAGEEVHAARLGIVFHTQYRGGKDLSKYRAKLGVDVSSLKKTRTCWFDDAFFKASGAAFTKAEYAELFSNAMNAQKLIGGFDRVVSLMSTLPSSAAGANIKTFINSYIRQGKYPDPDKAFDDYVSYLKTYWEDKVISKVKTVKSKDQKRAALHQLLSELKSIETEVKKSFHFVHLITKAKIQVVKKLDTLNRQRMFVKTENGYEVTAPEGYVAIGSAGAVKFVDRLEFSHFNFSDAYLKGWQK